MKMKKELYLILLLFVLIPLGPVYAQDTLGTLAALLERPATDLGLEDEENEEDTRSKPYKPKKKPHKPKKKPYKPKKKPHFFQHLLGRSQLLLGRKKTHVVRKKFFVFYKFTKLQFITF